MEYAVYMASLQPLPKLQTDGIPATLETRGIKRLEREDTFSDDESEGYDWTKKIRIEEQASYLNSGSKFELFF